MTITIKELAAELGMDRSYLRRFALENGIQPHLRTAPGSGRKPLLTVTPEQAAEIRKRRDPGYVEEPPTPDKFDKALALVLERSQLKSGRPQVGAFVRISDRLERIVEWESSFPRGPEDEPLEDLLKRAFEWHDSREDNGTYEGRFTLADTKRGGRFKAIFFGLAPHVVWEQGRRGDTLGGGLVPTHETKEAEFWIPRHGQTNRVSVPISIEARVWAVTR